MYMMFYDMGAYSTQVSVVSYQLVKSKDKIATELQPQLTVLGVGFVYEFNFLLIALIPICFIHMIDFYILSAMNVIWVVWKYNYD